MKGIMLSQVDNNVHARIEHQCPRCGRYSSMHREDLREDGLGFKWICNPFVPDGRGGYDAAGCGWGEI